MSDKSGTPLILLHGALGSSEQWDKLKSLLGYSSHIYAFNFSGHGGRVCSEPFSLDMFLDDLRRFIEKHSFKRVNLFGYSMGGYVALKYAAEEPSMVGKVMTLGTKFNWTPETAAGEVKMLDPEVIAEKVPAFASVLEARHAPVDWKGVVRNTAQFVHGLGHGNAVDFASEGIEAPVLITVGDVDRVVKFGEAVGVANALPNGSFTPIPGAGHPLEQVPMNTLADVVREFFF